MSTVPDSLATQTPPLNSLIGATAANEDSMPESTSAERNTQSPRGWEPREVWLRMIKEPRDGRRAHRHV